MGFRIVRVGNREYRVEAVRLTSDSWGARISEIDYGCSPPRETRHDVDLALMSEEEALSQGEVVARYMGRYHP
jgi:hypothetical protein